MSQYLLKWFYLGLNLKRWLALFAFAAIIAGLGFAYLLRTAYLAIAFPDEIYWLTLQFIPRWIRGLLFILVAVALALTSGWKLRSWIVHAAIPEFNTRGDIVGLAYRNVRLANGPKIVVLGGGTGLANLLRSLKQISSNISAIVTVADDGGSSGRLRNDLGVIPPGDIRNCITALAEDESLVTQLFQYRFDEIEGNSISGHSFGNLFLTAMTAVSGNMEAAIDETCKVLQVRGRIIPASLQDVKLIGTFDNGLEVLGESKIPQQGYPPKKVRLSPDSVAAHPQALKAISEADLILIGPGSLYTSILPNLLVSGMVNALQRTSVPRIYISNVATQYGETNGYSAARHYAALCDHVGVTDIATVILANDNIVDEPFPPEWKSQPVLADVEGNYGDAELMVDDVVDVTKRYRHDGDKLVSAILSIFGSFNRS